MSTFRPTRCILCNERDGIVSTQFRQHYPQKDSPPVILDWWECKSCSGWFVHPMPARDAIEKHWQIMDWADPKQEIQIARSKKALQERILEELSRLTKPGSLLDLGSSFGQFMLQARESDWVPYGFEPNPDAAKQARLKGLEVRSGWSLHEAGFSEGSFAAITVIDVFCLVWDPNEMLRTLHRLLKPGGILAMRLTNKRPILGLVRSLNSAGKSLDAKMSRLILPQFHSIGIAPLTRILKGVGFDRIRVLPNATTAPWTALSWQTRTAYLGSYILYLLSLRKVNLSPGILLFARKSIL